MYTGAVILILALKQPNAWRHAQILFEDHPVDFVDITPQAFGRELLAPCAQRP